jgi:hypothetical protein
MIRILSHSVSASLPTRRKQFPGQSSYNPAGNIGELHIDFTRRAMIFVDFSSTGFSLWNLVLARPKSRRLPFVTVRVKSPRHKEQFSSEVIR